MSAFTSLAPTIRKTTLAPPSMSPPPVPPSEMVATSSHPRVWLVLLVVIVGLGLGMGFTHKVGRKTPGVSQPRETENGFVEHWSRSATIVLDRSLEDLTPGATDAVRSAIAAWIASVPNLPPVQFQVDSVRNTQHMDGKSVVMAAPITTPGHEKDLALTTTYASDGDGSILEADIVFNTNYNYAVMTQDDGCHEHTFDVGAVATHESGHFFGLGEDYDDTTTTMYLITNPCDVHKRVLSAPDVSVMANLYDALPPVSSPSSCSAAPHAPSNGGLVWLALGLAAYHRRRWQTSRWIRQSQVR